MLAEAARRMGIGADHLGRLVRERSKPAPQRRYSAALHAHYLTKHFVKDTKGRREAGRGNFPWHIADEHVERFERSRRLALSGRNDPRRGAQSIAEQLREVGL